MTDLAGRTPQHFDIGRVAQRTFGVIQRNFAVLLVLGLLLATLPAMAFGWAQYQFISAATGLTASGHLPAAGFGAFSGKFGIWIIGVFAFVIGAFMFQAGAVHATIADLNGRRASLSECLATGFRFFLPLLGLTMLMGIALMFGFVLLVVPGIMMAVAWIVAIPAEVTERTGVFGAFSRSAELTRGHRWPIFALALVYIIAALVVQMALTGITGGFSMALSGKTPLISSVLITPLLQLINIVSVVGAASIYYELRTIKEGIGPEALASVFD